jgi:2-polyprenyl-3-methyl-5-hydroxy-6-metoxy-1,4-benzoquinol methylase
MPQTAPLTPQLFFETATSYHRSAALKTAIELGIFSVIGDGAKTTAEIASAVQASERGVRILCDALTVMAFLCKTGEGYTLTTMSSAFLDRDSQMYLGDAIYFLTSEAQKRGFEDLTGAVRRGGSAVEGNASLDENSEMWVEFARGMMPMMFPMAQMLAQHLPFPEDTSLKVLDIAAGHGIFGIAVAQRYAGAHIYGADWENVLAVAKENAAKFGVTDRYHTIPGDAFKTEFGDGYDLILLPNFLHHFDAETCTQFLRKCHAALNDSGRVVTVEFIPNEDRISPPMPAMFSLIMLAATPGGDAYTFAELKEMLENAGFSQNEHISLAPMPSDLVISSK